MKKKMILRTLGASMNDSYSIIELYSVFESEVFSKPKKMDVSLIRETARAMDDRDDEVIAPHKDYVWQKIWQSIQDRERPFRLGMTKKRFAIIVTVLVLLITAVALAITFIDELRSVWENSFSKMNTTGHFDAVPMEGFDLEGFEVEYRENTGLDHKDDLVISTVPEPGGLSYEQAYTIARTAIIERFGTPEEELDAMGIYPTFIQGVYETDYSEWEFYFSPRKNVNIDEDHSYDAPGEYRVEIQSPSGEVTMCNWYIDEFWPDYALRTWNTGRCDYVWAEACRGGAFYKQSLESQEMFRKLFTDKGYDTSLLNLAINDKLKSVALEIKFSSPSSNLLNAGDPYVEAAIAVMEKQYGMSKEFMDKAAFCAIYSPLQSDTIDICFTYNYEIGSERINNGEWRYGMSLLAHYTTRFGIIMVCLDPASLEPVDVVHYYDKPETESTTGLLMERHNWSVEDIGVYCELRDELQALDDQCFVSGVLTEEELQIQCDVVMRRYGGSQEKFPREPLEVDDVTEEEALRFAIQYLADQNGCSTEEIRNQYTVIDAYYDSQWKRWCVRFFTGPMEDTGIAEEIWIDARTGEVSILEGESNG